MSIGSATLSKDLRARPSEGSDNNEKADDDQKDGGILVAMH